MEDGRRGWPYEPVDAGAVCAPPPPSVAGPATPAPEEEPEPGPSRTAVLLLALAGALAVILVAAAVADWWSRNRELDLLLDRIEVAERAQLPAQQTIGPLLRQCRFEDVCDTAGIQRAAAATLPQLQESGDAVAATRLTRFHTALRTLRDRYVDHNLAWQGWLAALARDPVGEREPPLEIDGTWVLAGDAADAAVPPLAFGGAQERVDRIFRGIR